MSSAVDNIKFVKCYLSAIEQGVVGEDIKEFYASDVVQVEFPNKLLPDGATRDLQAILDASIRGQKVITRQRYDIRNIVATEQQVAIEVLWTGTLAIDFGSIPSGGEMTAYFAQFIEIRDGKIISQRTYDCFNPW